MQKHCSNNLKQIQLQLRVSGKYELIKESTAPLEQLSLFAEEEPAVATKVKKKSNGVQEREEKVIKKLIQKDVLHMTPIEAIQFVNELQRLLK